MTLTRAQNLSILHHITRDILRLDANGGMEAILDKEDIMDHVIYSHYWMKILIP